MTGVQTCALPISRRTLLHYDEIDLFKPIIVDTENNYRYYLEDQLMDLYFILALKRAGFSLFEIKEYTKGKNIKESEIFLESKEKIIDSKIKELETLKDIIKRKRKELKKIEVMEDLKPSIITAGPFKVILIDVQSPFETKEVVRAFNKVYELEEELTLKNKKYLSKLSLEDLKNNIFNKIRSTGVLLSEKDTFQNTEIIPKGKFASLIYTGSYESLEFAYKKLLEYIEQNCYTICGDSIEIVNEWMVQVEGGIGGIVKILIPVEIKKDFREEKNGEK